MFVLIRAVVYATCFIALFLVFLPARLLGPPGAARPALGAAGLLGMVMAALGAALVLWCILAFATLGRGTPAPFDPPRRLVVRGPYRFVRNPMYVGAGLVLFGAALVYRSAFVAAYGLGFLLALHAFVLWYEEPTLRRLFGAEYDTYTRTVGRWWPNRR